MFELKIKDFQSPEAPVFNYEELKQELTEAVKQYENLIYTDDQIREAKSDKANLNKLKKALNDERIKREKEYLKPFNVFKEQISEIISIIDEPVKAIDKQVKEYDERIRQDKIEAIKDAWSDFESPDWLTLEKIYNPKWENKSYGIKQVKEDIENSLDTINEDLKTIDTLEEFSFESREVYQKTLDLNSAISEGKCLADIQKRKAQAKKEDATPQPPKVEERETTEQVKRQWVNVSVYLSVSEARSLNMYFKDRGIQFKAI